MPDPLVQRVRRILVWTFAALALLTWLRWNIRASSIIAGHLDHCEEMACDFVHHYLPQVRQLFSSDVVVPGWLYPPFLAILLQPLRLFSDAGAVSVWLILQVVLAVCAVAQVRRVLRPLGRWASWAGGFGLVFLSLPIVHSVKWGQVSLLICVLSIWALERRTRVAAFLLGALAALKMYPLFYALPWLLLGKRRESAAAPTTRALALWFGASAIGLGIVLPLVLLGPRLTGLFAQGMFSGTQILTGRLAYLGGQAIEPTLVRFLISSYHAGREQLDHSPLLFSLGPMGWDSFAQVCRSLLIYLPAAVIVGISWWRLRKGASIAETASLTMLTVALALPPGWHHYFAFLPYAIAVALMRQSAVAIVCSVIAFLASAWPLFLLVDVPGIYFATSTWGLTTLAGLAAWVGLIAGAREREVELVPGTRAPTPHAQGRARRAVA